MDNEGVKEIADLAKAAAGVEIFEITEETIRGEPIQLARVLNSQGGVDVRSIKPLLDEWRTAPERVKGTARASTIDAFTDLVDRHKSADSAIFACLEIKQPSLTAVINYHSVNHDPQYLDHRIVYAFPMSEEWKAWHGQNFKPMSQGDWAAFIEDHIADLSSPLDQEASTYETMMKTKFAAPSELVTLSRGMVVSVNATVKEIRTLQSGEAEISYEEVHNDGRGKKLVVPGLFIVSIPLFLGAEKERIICRLRYRKEGERVVWFYQMYRPDIVVREYLERTVLDVTERTGLPSYEATPEA